MLERVTVSSCPLNSFVNNAFHQSALIFNIAITQTHFHLIIYVYLLFNHSPMIIYCFRNVTLESLAIPDTFCSPDKGSGYQCPTGMECMALQLTRKQLGFDGFDMFGMVYLLITLAKYLFRSPYIFTYRFCIYIDLIFCFRFYVNFYRKSWESFIDNTGYCINI